LDIIKILKGIAFFLVLFIVGELIYFSYVRGWHQAGILEETIANTNENELMFARRLWNWVDLLIIPFTLGLIAVFLYRAEVQRQEKLARRTAKMKLNIADERNQDLALTHYFDRMNELILDRNLKNAPDDSDVTMLAKTLTHVLLLRVDKRRKAIVIKYLYKTGLINLMKR